MAPKKKSKGASTSAAAEIEEEEHVREARAARRTPDEQVADEQRDWEKSCVERVAKNERQVVLDANVPSHRFVIEAIHRQGMDVWFNENSGYNLALVREFYKNMRLPPPETFLEPGARITSTIGTRNVYISATRIAEALQYMRPPLEAINFPRPPEERFSRDVIAHAFYVDRTKSRLPHKPGRFRDRYRLLNQVIMHNLYPRGTENQPSERAGHVMFAFGEEDTVCDWALFIFGEMCEARHNKKIRHPYPCLVSNILWNAGVSGSKWISPELLVPGPVDSSVLTRSTSQTRTGPTSLYAKPAEKASGKDWLKQVFCQNIAIMDSMKKKKREDRERAREEKSRWAHLERQVLGQTTEPYATPQFPQLEVSDDFVQDDDDDDDA